MTNWLYSLIYPALLSLQTVNILLSAANAFIFCNHLCTQQKNDGLAYIPFSAPAPKRRIALFWRKSSAKRDIFLEIADDLASRAIKDEE